MATELSEQDLLALKKAVRLSAEPPFIIRATNLIGKPVSGLIKMTPKVGKDIIAQVTNKSLEVAFNVAKSTFSDTSIQESSDKLHTILATLSGGIGGFFGISGVVAELPATTGVMMRSILDIARSEGADINDPETKLACIQVFSLEGGRPQDDDADMGFYGSRIALSQLMSDAAKYFAEKGVGKITAPPIAKLLEVIAARFGVTISEKIAAQAVPIIGAVMGGGLNAAFIDYYQDLARAHFILRRLESKYDPDLVHRKYNFLLGNK